MVIERLVFHLNKAKRLLKKFLHLFPSPVPMGVTEFNVWAQDIIDTYEFPDNESVKFALATMIMHSGPRAAYVPKHQFALMVKAGAAKQIASYVFQEIKNEQKKRIADEQAAAAKAAAEAPAAPADVKTS